MRTPHFALAILAVAFMLGSSPLRAVDPLPPEIEKASLEKKIAYWQKTSKESAELKQKVAQERYQKALVYKGALLAQAEANYQNAEAKLEGAARTSGGAAAAAPQESSAGLYLLLALVLGGGVFLMHRNLREAENPA